MFTWAPVIVLSGKPGVGKSTVALELVRQLGAFHAQTSSMILKLRPETERSRTGLQDGGNDLDRQSAYGWISSEVSRISEANPGVPIIVDAPRVPLQVSKIRAAIPGVVHVHLTAMRSEILSRFARRRRAIDDSVSYETIEADPSEQWDAELTALSDLSISTDNLAPAEISIMIIDFTKR